MITSLKDTKVLVTGATGFIGSHLVRRLVAEGAEVYGQVRKLSGRRGTEAPAKQVKLFEADLRDFEAVRRIVRETKSQKIFHLAAFVDVSRSLEVIDEMVEVNIRGTLNLLRALEGTNYDCFINTGTSEEYGDNPAPFREDQNSNPVSPYSASKAATTMFCRMLHKTMGLPIVTLRPFLTYGPGQESDMLIPSLIKEILQGESFEMTEGKQTREFNYVDDTVDGFVRASVTPGAIGEIINIGNGVEYRVRDIVQKILDLLDSPIKPRYGALRYRPGETMHFYCDNSKAREILGWNPKVNLDEGLKITVEWFRKHYSGRK